MHNSHHARLTELEKAHADDLTEWIDDRAQSLRGPNTPPTWGRPSQYNSSKRQGDGIAVTNGVVVRK